MSDRPASGNDREGRCPADSASRTAVADHAGISRHPVRSGIGWVLTAMVFLLPAGFFWLSTSILGFVAPARLVTFPDELIQPLLQSERSVGLAAADLAARYTLTVPVLLLPLTAVAACLAAGRALVDRFGYTPRTVLIALLTVVAGLLAAGAVFMLVSAPQTPVPRSLVVDQVLRLAESHGLAMRDLNAPPQWLGYLGFGEETLTVGAASSMFVLFQLVGYGAFLVMRDCQNFRVRAMG